MHTLLVDRAPNGAPRTRLRAGVSAYRSPLRKFVITTFAAMKVKNSTGPPSLATGHRVAPRRPAVRPSAFDAGPRFDYRSSASGRISTLTRAGGR